MLLTPRFRVAALLALLVLVSGCPRTGTTDSGDAPAPLRERLVDNFSDAQLLVLLDAFEYEPSLVDEGSMTFDLEPGRVMLFNRFEGDLQLYYVMTGGQWTHEQINEWNRTRRLSRAYLDTEGDLVLEADLLSLGGITERQVVSFIAVFEKALRLFVTEVASQGFEGTPEELPTEPEGGWH
ncbi:MAG: YbjN domain-containing protein [Deltaproteobacteria bacterium]|nr:YbjN domain-containing protein [Deltaproteobacteria bacterium]